MELLSELHPFSVHFPIAIFVLHFFIELVLLFYSNSILKKTSLWILSFGILTAVLSVITGNQAFQYLTNNHELQSNTLSLIERHEYFATLSLWYFLAVLIIQYYLFIKRKWDSNLKYVLIIIIFAGVYLILLTGNIGGDLVYELGLGTKLFK